MLQLLFNVSFEYLEQSSLNFGAFSHFLTLFHPNSAYQNQSWNMNKCHIPVVASITICFKSEA